MYAAVDTGFTKVAKQAGSSGGGAAATTVGDDETPNAADGEGSHTSEKASSIAADAAFAAQLQAEEYGGGGGGGSSSSGGSGGGGGAAGAVDNDIVAAGRVVKVGSDFERVGLRAGSAEDEVVSSACTASLKYGFLVQTALHMRDRIDSLASFCVICDQKHSWGGGKSTPFLLDVYVAVVVVVVVVVVVLSLFYTHTLSLSSRHSLVFSLLCSLDSVVVLTFSSSTRPLFSQRFVIACRVGAYLLHTAHLHRSFHAVRQRSCCC